MKTKWYLCVLLIAVVAAIQATAVFAEPIIWESNLITFTKASWADWTKPANQDHITSNVWLTRADYAGLFNIAQESSSDGYLGSAPADTEWAFSLYGLNEGRTMTASNYSNLDFYSWGESCDWYPPGLVDTPGVVHLISDDIYLNIKFTSWAVGQDGGGKGGGGFSYERTSPVPLPPSLLLLAPGLLGLAGLRKRFSK
ncbi:MAG: hypothetical protein NT010_07895 [Proteobacteria bacterium]|nr:hypothetical protein [Pseudomonadota bacterium]